MEREDNWRQQQEQEEEMQGLPPSRLDELLTEHKKHKDDLEAILWSQKA